VDAVQNPVADSLDNLAEKREQAGFDGDLDTGGGSHCPLEPYDLHARCQIPYE